MVDGEAGKDAFEVVRDFVEDLKGREPAREEVERIAPALKEIHERFVRVRAYVPKADLSERVWLLLEMAGLAARPASSNPFRNAASFL